MTVRLRLGDLGWTLVDQAAAHMRVTPGAFVQEACHRYHRNLLAPTPRLEAPRFRVGGGRHERTLTLTGPETMWSDLRLEAGRQGIQLERLIEHAVVLETAVAAEA